MNKLAIILKSSKLLYNIYYYVMSALIKVLGVFVGSDDKLILLNSYGGKKYDDSPKAIYEKMLCDSRFNEYRFVWAIQKPDSVVIPGKVSIVKADSFKYFVTALKAKIWITNSSMERGLSFKKKKTLCFNTWHGTPIKKMGIDLADNNKSFTSNVLVRADIMLAQSQYDIDVFSHAFKLPKDSFRLTGLPRNDVLANNTDYAKSRIRELLGIDEDKTVLLYAPTFREYTKGDSNEVVLDIPINPRYWQDELGDRFIVLFRAHYEVAKHMNLGDNPVFRDVSGYPSLNDLMIVSDALISDYSSIFFDYSITHKPMYCFAYDYDEYCANRGMYLDLKEEFSESIYYDEDSLIDELLSYNEHHDSLVAHTKRFQEKYVSEYGYGAEKSCEEIMSILNG